MIGRRHSLLVSLGAFVIAVLAVPVYALNLLTDVETIHELSLEQAEQSIPVEVEAQVMVVNPFRMTFFLFDGKAGIFVRGPSKSSEPFELTAGAVVRVRGNTNPGGFATSIQAESIQIIDHEPRPVGVELTEFTRLSPGSDGDWVSTRGRLISKTVHWDLQAISIEISRNDLLLNIQMPYSKYNEQKLTDLMFDFVEFSAVCGTVSNPNHQAVGRIFFVNSADDFERVAELERPGQVPVRKITDLYHYKAMFRREVITRGIVTHLGLREMYLRDAEGALKVAISVQPDLAVGDEVEIEGVVWPQPVSPAFRARTVKRIGRSEIPLPVKISGPIAFNHNYDLIEVNAELVEIGKIFLGADGVSQPTLLCRAAGQLFEVLIPAGAPLASDLKPGARLRLTGICHVIRNANIAWYLKSDGFSLEVRGLEDVVVLAKAPWWTIRRLLWLLVSVFASMVLFIAWAGLLKRTVRQQMGVIRDKMERETIHAERQRIARELHDNLMQGLVGMAIQLHGCFRGLERGRVEVAKKVRELRCPEGQLDAVCSEVDGSAGRTRQALQGVQDMLDKCSEDSRASVLYLRSGLPARMELATALEEVLEPLFDELDVEFNLRVTGTRRALQQEVERNLMLGVKEVVTNAIRHASASRIEVGLDYSEGGLSIRVSDDGVGFVVDHRPLSGHYGLQGLGERLKQLKGAVHIDSVLGRGTEVFINLESTGEWEV